jgi:dTDP-4-dehydrorhamnose reductase
LRALVLGGTGMLGRAIVRHWRLRGQPCLALGHGQADLLDADGLLEWSHRFQPQVVINCAAFTQVDACEEQTEKAMAINGDGVANAVRAAAATDAQLIHISSDYVFDGQATGPIPEDAPTNPLSAYGRSKLRGEEVAREYPRALVLRTSWLFGPDGPNFVATIRRLLLEGRTPLRVVDDQWGRPTYTPFLARAIADLTQRGTVGTLHYGNRSPATWHELAVQIAHWVDPQAEVLAVTTAEFPRPAHRPAYSVLDVSRFEATVGRRVETWISGLAAYLDAFPFDP